MTDSVIDLCIKGRGYPVIEEQLNLHLGIAGSIVRKWKVSDSIMNSEPTYSLERATGIHVGFMTRTTRKELFDDL